MEIEVLPSAGLPLSVEHWSFWFNQKEDGREEAESMKRRGFEENGIRNETAEEGEKSWEGRDE